MDSNTTMRNLGIGLTVIGFVLLVGYTLYILITTESNLILKISIVAIVAGILLVILTLLKEKTGVKDKEIERRY
ncbi:MAG: hypothetical protein JXA98_05210 [Methanosarcinaceae archaeon]|nr:hypothetical protein [Methanosarcinaceae archaeon]